MLLNETITIMSLPKELTTVTKLSKYLAMVVFIALPFVGFFLGVRYQEMMDLGKSQQEESNLAIPRAPTPTPDETVNWKTYIASNSLTFRYPEQSFNIYGNSLENGVTLISTDKEVVMGIFTHPNTERVSRNAATNPIELFIGGAPLYSPKYLDNPSYSKLDIKVSETLLGGIKAYQITTPPPQYTEGILNLEIATIKGDKNYHIEVWGFKESLDIDKKKLVDQILSTVRFLP